MDFCSIRITVQSVSRFGDESQTATHLAVMVQFEILQQLVLRLASVTTRAIPRQ
jgi:hypothetical protein